MLLEGYPLILCELVVCYNTYYNPDNNAIVLYVLILLFSPMITNILFFAINLAVIYMLQHSGQIPFLICILPGLSVIIVVDVIMDEKN